jgi:hypothetical protein
VVLLKGFEAAGDAPNGELLDDAPKARNVPLPGWLLHQIQTTQVSVSQRISGFYRKQSHRLAMAWFCYYTTTGCNIVLYFRLGVLISTMTPSLILSHRVLVAIKHRVVASMAKTDSETYHAVLKKIVSAPRVKEARRESRKTGQSARQKIEERTVKGQMRRGRYKEMKEEQSFKGFHITYCVRTTYWRRKQASDEREREREREEMRLLIVHRQVLRFLQPRLFSGTQSGTRLFFSAILSLFSLSDLYRAVTFSSSVFTQ